MSQGIDINAIRAQMTDAFVDLGFKLTNTRLENFLQLCVQYVKLESGRVWDRVERQEMRLSPVDVLDYCIVSSIQHFGEQLWPSNYIQRGHLEGGWIWKGQGGDWKVGLVFKLHENCRTAGNNDRSLWKDKLRSPLGSKVKRYFQGMERALIISPNQQFSSQCMGNNASICTAIWCCHSFPFDAAV